MDNNNNLTLQDLNDKEIRKLIAPIVYLVFLLVLGIPGNLTILLIYRNKFYKSVYRTLIWNLAWIDLLFCTITIPFNIGRFAHYYTFTELWICKTFTTAIVFFVLHSSHLLLALCIHRFRQVCMPLHSQVTPNNVKYWIFGGLFLAIVLDIPEGILQPLDHVKLAYNITGHVCAVSFHASIYADLYNGFLTFLFSLYSLILFVLYATIGRKVYMKRNHKIHVHQPLTSGDEISFKITKVAIAVTTVFAVSNVPLFVIKLFAGFIYHVDLSIVQFATLKILERSYIITHVANPFIYAFYDKCFRRDLKKLLKRTLRTR